MFITQIESILNSTGNIAFQNSCYEFKPTSARDVIKIVNFLYSKKEGLIFRGQKKSIWVLDSTFARTLKEELKMPEGIIFSENTRKDKKEQHNFFQRYYSKYKRIITFQSLNELAKKNKEFDPKFEFLRNIQQNPYLDEKPQGTNFLDFTIDPKIGLFFANNGRCDNEEGALYIVIQKNIGKAFLKTLLDEAMEEYRKLVVSNREYSYLPILICPKNQLNNKLDQKPIRQKAIYFCQMDFRYNLDCAWKALHRDTNKQVYFRIILPKGSQIELCEFLTDEGITQEFVFHQDNNQISSTATES